MKIAPLAALLLRTALLLPLLLAALPAHAETGDTPQPADEALTPPVPTFEPVTLLDGSTVYSMESDGVPDKLRGKACDNYAFRDKEFTPLPNGRYTTKERELFLVEDNCVFALAGQAKLKKDGRIVEFYLENETPVEGDLVVVLAGKVYQRLDDGNYTLENGDAFTVKGSRLVDNGHFDGEHVGNGAQD